MKIKLHYKITFSKSMISNLFWTMYFLMIAIPLHASNKLLTYLSFRGNISIFLLFSILFLIIFLLFDIRNNNLKVCKNVNTLFICIFAFLILFSICFGIFINNVLIKDMINDSALYIMGFNLFLIVRSKYIEIISLEELLKLTYYAMIINCCINIIMYITQSWSFWGLISFNGGRFGGGYYTVLIVSILYGFYDFMNQRRLPVWMFIFALGTSLYCSILAQSRTHVIMIIIGCVLILLFGAQKLKLSYFIKIIIALITIILGIYLLLQSNNDLTSRILSIDIFSKTETSYSRILAWNYYWDLIKKTPLGHGFGTMMYFLNLNGLPITSLPVFNVDNAFIIVLFKGGWIFGILYIYFTIFTPIRIIIKLYNLKKDKFYMIFLMIYVMIIFTCMIMSSQAIHTYATMVFIWIISGSCFKWEDNAKDFLN